MKQQYNEAGLDLALKLEKEERKRKREKLAELGDQVELLQAEIHLSSVKIRHLEKRLGDME